MVASIRKSKKTYEIQNEIEYMKVFSSVKVVESVRESTGVYESRKECMRVDENARESMKVHKSC